MKVEEILDKFDNLIFDFDGTLVKLNIDWNSLKKETDELCLNLNIDISMFNYFNEKVDFLKSLGEKGRIMEIIRKYEQPNGVVNYKVNSWLVDYVSKNNKKYFIISNNLSSTIAYVLNEIGISNRFKSIIGIDRVSLSKPNPEAFDIIKNMLVSSKTVFIGDTEKDRIFAQNCNITFIFVGGWL